jgi:hypothetical protein
LHGHVIITEKMTNGRLDPGANNPVDYRIAVPEC